MSESNQNNDNTDILSPPFVEIDEDEMRLEDERLKFRPRQFYQAFADRQFIALVANCAAVETAIRFVEQQLWHDKEFDKLEDGHEVEWWYCFPDYRDEPDWIRHRREIPLKIKEHYETLIETSIHPGDLKNSLISQVGQLQTVRNEW